MLTAPRPESVREAQKVLFPDLVENPPYRVLHYFVFQRRDSQWSLPPIAFRDPDSPRRSRLIGPSMDAPVQVADSRLQAFSILPPRHPVHSRRSLLLQTVVTIPEQIDRHMVQQSRVPHLPLFLRYFPHTFQSVWPALPILRPVLVSLFRVLLGQRPFLHNLRLRFPALVRLLRRYYAAVRLPIAVHGGLIAHRFLHPIRRLAAADSHGVSRFSRMEFLCVHGVFDSAGHGTLALTRTALLPSVLADAVGSLDCRFRSSIPSPHMPLSNASSAASRLPSHGSGSGWSLLLSCVTLSFTTPRRFIPTLSSQDWLSPRGPRAARTANSKTARER